MWWIESLTVPSAEPAEPAEDDILVLRFGAPPREGAVQGIDYLVCRQGDTLTSLADEVFGDASLAETLALLNPLADPEGLVPGQVLYLR